MTRIIDFRPTKLLPPLTDRLFNPHRPLRISPWCGVCQEFVSFLTLFSAFSPIALGLFFHCPDGCLDERAEDGGVTTVRWVGGPCTPNSWALRRFLYLYFVESASATAPLFILIPCVLRSDTPLKFLSARKLQRRTPPPARQPEVADQRAVVPTTGRARHMSKNPVYGTARRRSGRGEAEVDV